MSHPDYDDVMMFIDAIQSKHSKITTVETIGQSVNGRDICAVSLTDPKFPDENKQHVLVIAGQHGSEESGRSIALELIGFLSSDTPESQAILSKQIISVIPCVNSDGAMQDSYKNADDIDIAHTYSFNTPHPTPEGRALEEYTARFIPDVFVDIHGLAGGSMSDRVWLSRVPEFFPERKYAFRIAQDMTSTAESAGYPMVDPTPARVLPTIEGISTAGEKIGCLYKAMTFGVETIEHYYKEPDWRQSGLIKLKKLLEYGQHDAFGIQLPGYPVDLVSGSKIGGLMAYGKTSADRRNSRIALTRFLIDNFSFAGRGEDGIDRCAKMTVFSDTCNGENPDRFSLILSIRKPCEIQSVVWDGNELVRDTDYGYETWELDNAIMVKANIMDSFGGNERLLKVMYDSPYLNGA